MKKNNILKVILIMIGILILLSWILQTGTISGTEFKVSDRVEMGLFDLFSYPMVILSWFSYTLLYILIVGGFYGILFAIPEYRTLLEKIVEKFKNKPSLFLVIATLFLSIITSVFGNPLMMMIFIPFIASLIIMLGYNKIVAAITTVGAISVGVIGTTLGSNTLQHFNSILEVNIFSNIWLKVLILLISNILLLFNLLNYAKKTHNKVEKEDLFLVPEKTKNKDKNKLWPLTLMLLLFVTILFLGIFDWEQLKITLFSDLLKQINEFKLFDYPIFAKILGNSLTAFGKWSIYVEIPALIFITSILISLVYKIAFNKMILNFSKGIKKTIRPAIFMMLLYFVLVITTNHNFQLVILNTILSLAKGFNVITLSIASFIASIFNIETTYLAQRTVALFKIFVTDVKMYPLLVMIFQTMYGLMLLIAPSSLILIGTLSYLDVSYTKWIKHIWKIFLELFILLLIILFIASMI